ncbi:hypothetical protein AB1484_36380, partial [Parafrankia sp. FMc6]
VDPAPRRDRRSPPLPTDRKPRSKTLAVDHTAEPRQPRERSRLATGGIVAVGLAAAVFAGPLAALSQRAADDLLEPSGYVESVLPGAVPVGLPRAVPAGAGR